MSADQKLRGNNYSETEDGFIARAIVRVSENAVVGSEQEGKKYYERIYKEFKENCPPILSELCNPRSVRGRVMLLWKECRSFASYYERVRRMSPSGTNEENIVRMKTGL